MWTYFFGENQESYQEENSFLKGLKEFIPTLGCGALIGLALTLVYYENTDDTKKLLMDCFDNTLVCTAGVAVVDIIVSFLLPQKDNDEEINKLLGEIQVRENADQAIRMLGARQRIRKSLMDHRQKPFSSFRPNRQQ